MHHTTHECSDHGHWLNKRVHIVMQLLVKYEAIRFCVQNKNVKQGPGLGHTHHKWEGYDDDPFFQKGQNQKNPSYYFCVLIIVMFIEHKCSSEGSKRNKTYRGSKAEKVTLPSEKSSRPGAKCHHTTYAYKELLFCLCSCFTKRKNADAICDVIHYPIH